MRNIMKTKLKHITLNDVVSRLITKTKKLQFTHMDDELEVDYANLLFTLKNDNLLTVMIVVAMTVEDFDYHQFAMLHGLDAADDARQIHNFYFKYKDRFLYKEIFDEDTQQMTTVLDLAE